MPGHTGLSRGMIEKQPAPPCVVDDIAASSAPEQYRHAFGVDDPVLCPVPYRGALVSGTGEVKSSQASFRRLGGSTRASRGNVFRNGSTSAYLGVAISGGRWGRGAKAVTAVGAPSVPRMPPAHEISRVSMRAAFLRQKRKCW